MDTNTSLDSKYKSNSGPVLGGRLFTNQIHILRGLRSRIRQLSISRSADSEKMSADRGISVREFAEKKSDLKSHHAADWSSAMTEWDVLLDKQFSAAERETLLSIHHERQQTKKLKSDFIQNKAETAEYKDILEYVAHLRKNENLHPKTIKPLALDFIGK